MYCTLLICFDHDEGRSTLQALSEGPDQAFDWQVVVAHARTPGDEPDSVGHKGLGFGTANPAYGTDDSAMSAEWRDSIVEPSGSDDFWNSDTLMVDLPMT
jgi:hypothetical protein